MERYFHKQVLIIKNNFFVVGRNFKQSEGGSQFTTFLYIGKVWHLHNENIALKLATTTIEIKRNHAYSFRLISIKA